MKKSQSSEITIPICGKYEKDSMAKIADVIRQLPGVSLVNVDIDANKIKVIYDLSIIDFIEFYQVVIDVGLEIPTLIATQNIEGMVCISCMARVEGALTDLPGVVNATVSLSKNSAKVTYVSDIVSLQNMENAIRKIGYQVIKSDKTI